MKKLICVIMFVLLCLSLCSCDSEEAEYTVTFYNNKGIYFYNSYTSSNGNVERMKVEYQDNTVYKVETFSGAYPPEPTPPQNAGYVFLGWYQDPECTEKFLFGHYEVNCNINLYAKWSKVK